MLQHEGGSRTDENIEDVHDMRVGIRRMRSTIRLMKPYIKRKDIRAYNRDLRRLGRALGEVRDLDVMIEHVKTYQATLDAEGQSSLQMVVDELNSRQAEARAALNDYFDSKAYHRFIKSFCDFLMQPLPERGHKNGVAPYQVRHVLPMLIYDRLAAVRAYETILREADPKTLHALRIEFKRLRYLLSLFQEVLGPQAGEVVVEIRTIQDDLGHLNDGTVARSRLEGLLDEENAALTGYLAFLEGQAGGLKENFRVAWTRFNSRRIQQKLATAVLALA
ncbi:MAG: CHAD domain-containing protein [Anaerolineae bacterium]|nr:CHAD domain-containing protein [Anaerolineae bacterium]